MGADDLEIARQFRIALEAAAKTGDREAVYPFLAADVEWVTPKRTLHGIDEVREELIWGSPPENLDLEFAEGDWLELGDGRVVSDVRARSTGSKGRATSPTNATGRSNSRFATARSAAMRCGLWIGAPRAPRVRVRNRTAQPHVRPQIPRRSSERSRAA